MTLTKDFNKAANGLAALEARVRHLFYRNWSDFPFSTHALPRLDISCWNGDFRAYNNCYNFALNIQDNTFLQPGAFYLSGRPKAECDELKAARGQMRVTPDIEAYANFVTDLAEKDGLIPLGETFRAQSDGFPVALFFRQNIMLPFRDYHRYENDYHWFALRAGTNLPELRLRDVFWAHKPSTDRAARCGNGRDLTCIFNVAMRYGYDYFGGFYEVCPDRLGAAFARREKDAPSPGAAVRTSPAPKDTEGPSCFP